MSEENTRVLVTFKQIVKNPETKEFCVRVKTIKQRFDPLDRKWTKIKPYEITYEPLETYDNPKLLKETEFSFIERRSSVDVESVLPIWGLFLHKLKVKIPNLSIFENVYLSQVSGRLYENDLSLSFTMELSIKSLLGSERVLEVQELSVKRISPEEADRLIKEGQTYPRLVERIGQEYWVRV